MDIGQEIDKLFLESGQEKDTDILQIIKTHIDSLTSYLESLNPFEKELNEHKQLHEFYKLKLETLSGELQEIEKRSISTQTQINNKKKMYDEIKQLLITIEIKPEYFNKVKNPNFHDLTGLRVALNALKSFECDYNIKAVNEKKERISRTLKDFMNEFMIFFQKRINTYETESRGELRIHQHVYDDIRKYSFVFEYCKEFDKNSFITLSRKYLTVSKSLYEKEFERHLKIVCKSLKEYKTKLKEKMNEALNVVVESFYLIVACESNFIGKTFDDNVSFENEYVTNMFNNVTEVIFDFIRDTYRMHSLFCINALCNIREISANQENSNLEIVQKFKIKLEDFLNDFKKDYIRIKTQHWKTQSKRKFYKELIDEIKANSYVEMNVELSQLFLAKINDIHQDKKGKIEFSLYKLNFINDVDALSYKENDSVIEDMNKKESETLEKNIITFVFGKDKDRIDGRIKIIRDQITNMYKDNNKRKISVLHTIKNMIDEQADGKVKSYTDKYLK